MSSATCHRLTVSILLHANKGIAIASKRNNRNVCKQVPLLSMLSIGTYWRSEYERDCLHQAE